MKISVFGTGYVGLVTGACFSYHGHDVMCVDIDENKITMLKGGKIPFYEPFLNEIVVKNISAGRLKFTTDAAAAVEHGDVIFNCVGTPSSYNGEADLSFVFSVGESIAQHIKKYKVIVTKSTVTPGTNRKLKLFMKGKTDVDFDIISNPEFLREGVAVYDFNHPDRLVIGYETQAAKEIMLKIYSGILRTYSNVILCGLETAEMIKYANNSFLSTKISFINEIANICNATGADIKTVATALGMDNRISARFLSAGIGYGGSCFPKDVRALVGLARQHGYEAALLREVDALNTRQRYLFLGRIVDSLKSLAGKTIGVWGLSFKPKTSDTREAPSIEIIRGLVDAGAVVKAYDPEAKLEGITQVNSAVEAAEDADAVVLLTEWDEFRNIDMKEIKEVMKGNKLFDGRNVYNPQDMKAIGFEYMGMGQ